MTYEPTSDETRSDVIIVEFVGGLIDGMQRAIPVDMRDMQIPILASGHPDYCEAEQDGPPQMVPVLIQRYELRAVRVDGRRVPKMFYVGESWQ